VRRSGGTLGGRTGEGEGMTSAARLNNKHIVVLRTLAKCDTTARGITLPKWMRRPSIHPCLSG
jgi:hypothetical protein